MLRVTSVRSPRVVVYSTASASGQIWPVPVVNAGCFCADGPAVDGEDPAGTGGGQRGVRVGWPSPKVLGDSRDSTRKGVVHCKPALQSDVPAQPFLPGLD